MSKKLPTVIGVISKKLNLNPKSVCSVQNSQPLSYKYWSLGSQAELQQFINEQLQEYPSCQKVPIHRNTVELQARSDQNPVVSRNQFNLAHILLKLQRRISYEQLEKLKYEVQSMSQVEIKRSSKTLYLIANRVKSSIDNDGTIQNDLLEQAKNSVSRIMNLIQQKKSFNIL